MNNAFWKHPLHYCTIGRESAESAEVKHTSQKNMIKEIPLRWVWL